MKILVPCKPENFTNYKNALINSGLEPVNALAAFDVSEYAGLVLPGGGDIDPAYFHEQNKGSKNIDSGLDAAQFKLMSQFVSYGKPVLGICKGMQIINVFFGGKIDQNLATAATHAYINKDQIHETQVTKDCFLYDLYGETFYVNSAHHQGCSLLGKNIVRVQTSTRDNVTEGIMHTTLPILGLQWHPERLCCDFYSPETINGSFIFDYFKSLL